MVNRSLRSFVFCCSFFTILFSYAESSGNFILTSPRVIDAGNTVYFTLTVFNVPQGEKVTLQLTHERSNTLIATSEVSVHNNYSTWVEMNVPPMSSDITAKLHVIGSFSNGYNIESFEEVRIRHNTILSFIQTDKPVYKPGQTIRFRVLPMDNHLIPLDEKTEGEIWIENPNGIRIAQWKQVQFTEGIKQFEVPLSDEPPLGTWTIHTLINKVKASQTFIVKKYVLPKFDVIIKPPRIVMHDMDIIPIEVCAKYTYGKLVEGNLKVKVTYAKKRLFERRRPVESIPSIEHQSQMTGCHKFRINVDYFNFGPYDTIGNSLNVFAEVTENTTGIVRNATTSIVFHHQRVKLEFIRDNDFYKPRMPYVGFLKATEPDGTPVTSRRIHICVTFDSKKCSMFNTDKSGLIKFLIKPSAIPRAITVEASTRKHADPGNFGPSESSAVVMVLNPWYSASSNYLQIVPTTEEFECDKAQKVNVQYTAEQGSVVKFYHQVLSKSRIVQQGSHQRTFYSKMEDLQYDFEDTQENEDSVRNETTTEIGEFILTFDTKATMSPISRLLIFYIRDDGEVVADSKKFRIEKCLKNKVNLQFRHEQQYPNTEASMLLTASPSSLCGIHMVDKSIKLLEDDKTFNAEKIFSILESYDTGKDLGEFMKKETFFCMDDFRITKPVQHKKGSSGRKRRLKRSYPIFDLGPHSPVRPLQFVYTPQAFQDAGMIVITDLKMKSYTCENPWSGRYDPSRPVAILAPGAQRYPLRSRISSEPNFDNIEPRFLSADYEPVLEEPKEPAEEIRSYFPETWLWELHTVDSSGETAIKRQLPHTITEWVGGAVCVNSKTGLGISDGNSITTFQPFFIDFQLPYSVIRGESLVFVVTVFNYLSECLPIKLSLEPSDDFTLQSELRYQKVCVCGGESDSVRFSIRPSTLGKVNITVYGYSIEQDDEVCGNDITARLSSRDAITKELLVEAEGFPKEDIFNYFICPENTNGSYATEVPLLFPDNVIMDSARAYVTVTGDVMGPALKGLKKLVRLPVGCGEQNMVLFTPNIFVMDYLNSTGRITEDTKEECLNYMKTGYQRELLYKRSDGSYSAFGKNDKEGSLWLTAFVLRSFGQAARFISIDENDLSQSKEWILKMQLENGCFLPSGKVFHKAMKGGLTGGEQALAPLTAYVLISLLESNAVNPDALVVANALKCLETEKRPDVYVLSLFAYASALAKESSRATKYMEELEKRAIVNGFSKFWEPSSDSKSVAVETAGYYVLACFEIDSCGFENVFSVVRWITQQRNSAGGFVSTQDTVVALQALAKYASYPPKKPLDIALAVETDDMSHGFKLDENNKLLTQQLKITDLPTTVDIDAYGDGCAIVQFSSRYNVEQIANDGGLELNVNARRRGSNECNLPSLGICMRYAVYKEKTNMAVLSVKLPSGFVADEWSLLLLENDEEIQLKRHDIDENEVNLYFEEITNDATCFEFHIKSEFEVKDIKPSIVRLYDYYQPEWQVTKEYSIPSACNTTSLPDLPWLPLFNSPPADGSPDSSDSADYANAESKDTLAPLVVDELDNTALSEEAVSEELNDQSDDDKLEMVDVLTMVNDTDQATPKKSSHLSTFTDVDHDLDFPDGLEGNIPVSVLPPDLEKTDCPICRDILPENFTSVYCNSAFALKVIIKESDLKTVKVIQDVSFYIDTPNAIKKIGELEYESDCVCSQLTQKGKVLFIVGSPVSLWNSSEKKHKIRLTNSVYVILVPQKQIQSFLTEAKISCADDP